MLLLTADARIRLTAFPSGGMPTSSWDCAYAAIMPTSSWACHPDGARTCAGRDGSDPDDLVIDRMPPPLVRLVIEEAQTQGAGQGDVLRLADVEAFSLQG